VHTSTLRLLRSGSHRQRGAQDPPRGFFNVAERVCERRPAVLGILMCIQAHCGCCAPAATASVGLRTHHEDFSTLPKGCANGVRRCSQSSGAYKHTAVAAQPKVYRTTTNKPLRGSRSHRRWDSGFDMQILNRRRESIATVLGAACACPIGREQRSAALRISGPQAPVPVPGRASRAGAHARQGRCPAQSGPAASVAADR